MELENHTSYPAELYRGCIDEQRMFGSVAVRRTYRVAGERLEPAESFWKVQPGPWECPYGVLSGDELFYRGGVDLFVFGSARAPGGKAASRVDVSVELGGRFRHTVAVFGERVWAKRGKELVASDPKPFVALPLTLALAYGGKDEWDELPIPFPLNPDGKGYAISEESAAGKPLPNIEHPRSLIRRWNDQPEPTGVGLCPPGFGPRALRSVEFDNTSGSLKTLRPTFYNAAFPDMIAPEARPGDRVVVVGVSAAGPIQFTLPPSGLRVRVRIGRQVQEREPMIDQVGIEPDLGRAFVSYRFPFRYWMVPLEKRSCELLEVPV
jgi:hypothetical protein